MKNGIIYIIELPSGKKYIGKTIQPIRRRIFSHIAGSFRKTSGIYHCKLARAIRKYFMSREEAKMSIKYSILYDNIKYSDLSNLEMKTIEDMDTLNNGYNSTLGGGGITGFRHSDKAKRKIGKSSSFRKAELAAYTKTNWKEVNDIRDAYKKHEERESIFNRFSHLAKNTIIDIIKNKTWVDDSYEYISNKKLNRKIANEIRNKYLTGKYTQKKLSKEYGVSHGAINNILYNLVWKDKRYSVEKIKNVARNNERSAAKLDKKTADKIRKLKNKYTIAELARMFLISGGAVCNIINKNTWKG